MAISKEQIWAAADAIDAAGLNPTLAAVRKTVGGGSFTTIQEAMTEWKARRAAKEAPAIEPAPQAVLDRLTNFGAEVWAIAIDVAGGRLAVEREALEAMRADAEIARMEAAELADELTSELEEVRAKVAELAGAEKVARAAADELRQRLAAAEARGLELGRREEALRQENDRERQAAADARDRAAELKGALAASERQIADLMSRLGPKDVGVD